MRMAGPFTTSTHKNVFVNPLLVESVTPINADGSGDGCVVAMSGIQETFFKFEESVGATLSALEQATL
jgi:hypothetical protein